MTNNQIDRLLEFANMQMAAEAFLIREGDSGIPDTATIRLRLEKGNTHASIFMPVQAEQFTAQYQVLAQYRNDPLLGSGSGFSGTLFKNRDTGELTLSFRSTEFIDDAVRDNKATNLLEIKDLGWAFGQIAEMEAWYKDTLQALGGPLEGKNFYVTGYSLGGHLATAFNILRREEATASGMQNPVIETYTFNGAGTGGIRNGRRLTDLVSDFNQVREDYLASPQWNALSEAEKVSTRNRAQSRVNEILAEQARVAGLSGVANAEFAGTTAPGGSQASLDYQIAALLASRDTVASSNFPLPGGTNNIPFEPVFAPGELRFANMTEVVGMESDGLAPSFIANSGVHYGVRQEIDIEAQPLARGFFLLRDLLRTNFLLDNPDRNNFGDTHSLVLLVDSLSLMAAMETLAPELTPEDAREIFDAMSSAKVSTVPLTQGKAEGDTLERTLDALRNLVLGPGQEPTLDYEQALEGNTWHLNNLREPFQNNLAELNDRIGQLTGENVFGIESLVDIDPDQLAMMASGRDAIAYRYALMELNPFAVVGDAANEVIYSPHNTAGQLDLFDVTGGTRALTGEWIADRAEFLAWKELRNTKNIDDTSALSRHDGLSMSQIYTDVDSDTVILVQGSPLDARTAYITFGGEGADGGASALVGGGMDDRLYGGGGDDTLQGSYGNDYLEGGSGNDTYVWNTGDGFDTILDTDGIGTLVINGQAISGGFQIAQNDYISADKQYLLHFEGDRDTGGVLIINGDLKIENFASGDLGVTLLGDGSMDQLQPTTAVFVWPYSLLTQGLGFGTDGADFVTNAGSANDNGSTFVAKGGDDFLEVSGDRYAEFFAGPGNDVIVGGDLSPYGMGNGFVGEAGMDIILGGDNNDAISGDFGGFFYRIDSFSLPTFSFDGGFSSGALDGEGFWHWTGDFPEPDVTDPPVEPFRGTYSEAFRYALGINENTDLNTLYDDYLEGGGGNDRIAGGNGSDVMFGGDGDDVIIGDGLSIFSQAFIQRPQWVTDFLPLLGKPGDDYIDGGPGNDMLGDDPVRVGLDSMGGSDIIIGGEGDDFLNDVDPSSLNQTTSNYLDGGEGNDILRSSNVSINGFDTLIGGPGNDSLTVGQRSNSYLEGGSGSDSYTAAFGALSFFPEKPPGSIVISDNDETGSDVDTLSIQLLSDFDSTPFITRDESNLYIGIHEFPRWLTIENWFSGAGHKIETMSVMYFDVSHQPVMQVHNIADIESRFTTASSTADFLWGTSGDDQFTGGLGNDTLYGGAGEDVLAGNEGNDVLDGGEGADVYTFNLGDGIDRLLDSGSFGSDGISFGPGIAPEMLTLGLDSLSINIDGNGDAIHLAGSNPAEAGNFSSIEYFQFADGTTWTYQQLFSPDPDPNSDPGPDPKPDSDPDPEGTDIENTNPGAGVGDPIGEPGGNDIVIGGAVEDIASGGMDEGPGPIEDISGVDTVQLDAGIGPGDPEVARGGDALAFDFGTDPASILWQLEQGYQVGPVTFAGRTVWNAQDIRNYLQRGSQLDPSQGDYSYQDNSRDRASGQVNSSNQEHDEQHDLGSRRERESIAELLDAYLSHKPAYDFESLETAFEQDKRRETVLTQVEIAQRWQRVGRYMDGLSDERDEDARQGAGELRGFDALNFLGGGESGGAFGYAGSTGATRGMGNLKTLQGLAEGLQRLALI